jgi:hypothetical protein
MRESDSTILRLVILVLAVGLALASLQYVRPVVCLGLCRLSEERPCPYGSCRFGEQRAGFPLPLVWDNYGGGSPLHMMGRVGPEDLINVFPSVHFNFVLDVLFYVVLLSLPWRIPSVMRSQQKFRALRAMTPFLVVVAIGWWGWYVSYQDVLSRVCQS